MNYKLLLSVLFLFVFSTVTFSQEPYHSKRKLFIHGGGSIPKSSRQVFVEMAGGKDANLVVIPTATSDANLPALDELHQLWGEFGVKKVSILHTRDPMVANDPKFSKMLDDATAVWFGGGDQRRLSLAYAQTEFEKKLLQRVDEGMVVGGTSAGAAIQSRFMISGGRKDPQMALGLNLMPNTIIDQHFLERSRLNRLHRASQAHPERIGIGISEATTLVIAGGKGKILGPGFVITMQSDGSRGLDIRSWNSGSEIDLRTFSTGHRVEVCYLNGVEEIFADDNAMDDFLVASARKAEELRQSMMIPGSREPNIKTLGRVIKSFLDDHAQLASDDQSIRSAFTISPVQVEQGFAGLKTDKDLGLVFASAFRPFAGPWEGQWADRLVEHQWSSTMFHSNFDWQGLRYRMFAPNLIDSDFQIQRYQYAWIGDGYGFNMIVTETKGDETREYILGYVEHIKDNDFTKVIARRPHVGISAGYGKLIWVTDKEVFFEEAFKNGNAMAYSIIGFRYETLDDRMVVKEGFQTQYQRKRDGLPNSNPDSQFMGVKDYRTYKLSISEPRKAN